MNDTDCYEFAAKNPPQGARIMTTGYFKKGDRFFVPQSELDKMVIPQDEAEKRNAAAKRNNCAAATDPWGNASGITTEIAIIIMNGPETIGAWLIVPEECHGAPIAVRTPRRRLILRGAGGLG